MSNGTQWWCRCSTAQIYFDSFSLLSTRIFGLLTSEVAAILVALNSDLIICSLIGVDKHPIIKFDFPNLKQNVSCDININLFLWGPWLGVCILCKTDHRHCYEMYNTSTTEPCKKYRLRANYVAQHIDCMNSKSRAACDAIKSCFKWATLKL